MTTHRIETSILIRGDGTVVDDAVVTLEEGVVAYAGPASTAPPTPGAVMVSVPAVMPGMWDAHCHFFGIRKPNLEALVTESIMVRAMRVTKDARLALEAGFTSVREVGGLGVYLARAIAEATSTARISTPPGRSCRPPEGTATSTPFRKNGYRARPESTTSSCATAPMSAGRRSDASCARGRR